MRELRQVPPPVRAPAGGRTPHGSRAPTRNRSCGGTTRSYRWAGPSPSPGHLARRSCRAWEHQRRPVQLRSQAGTTAGHYQGPRCPLCRDTLRRTALAEHGPSAHEDVRRVFAALDQGRGHAHIRHEGWLSAEKSQLRVLHLQDPAQLDPVKRADGKDGLLPGAKSHYCAAESTAIRDPAAFAIAFARGVEHPDIRAALETSYNQGEPRPRRERADWLTFSARTGISTVRDTELAGDNPKQAVTDRRTWLQETKAGELPTVPPPLIVPIDFRGGTVQLRFKIDAPQDGLRDRQHVSCFIGLADRTPMME